jgi:hypothetical protein
MRAHHLRPRGIYGSWKLAGARVKRRPGRRSGCAIAVLTEALVDGPAPLCAATLTGHLLLPSSAPPAHKSPRTEVRRGLLTSLLLDWLTP